MSNIQQTNQINVNEPNHNINSEYYLNLMIGSQIANQISKFNAKDGKIYLAVAPVPPTPPIATILLTSVLVVFA